MWSCTIDFLCEMRKDATLVNSSEQLNMNMYGEWCTLIVLIILDPSM